MPQEWKMTPKRKEELARYRLESMMADQQRMMNGMLVDGVKQIEQAFKKPAPASPIPSPLMVKSGLGAQRVVGVRR